MRKLISTLMQLGGIACLVVAAFDLSTVAGVAALGVALVCVGNVAEPRR